MEISAVSGTAGNSSVVKTAYTDIQRYALRVQSAVGPKHFSGNGLRGQVTVSFSVGADGSLAGVRVAHSSGQEKLDARALQIIGRASFPTPPSGLNVMHRSYVSVFTFD